MSDAQLENQLDRIEQLLRVAAKALLAPVLERELTDDRREKLYALTGKKSAKAIAKQLQCSLTWVSDTWKRWEQLGILTKKKRGAYDKAL